MSPPTENRAETLVYRWCGLAVVAATGVSLGWLQQEAGWEGVRTLGGLALTSLLLLGKFVIFIGLHEDTALGPFALALMVWLIDLLIAFALASGLEGLERAPMLGRWLRKARSRSRETLDEYPRLQNTAFFGVVTFVLLPLAATGAVTGSFAARLLGLSRLAGVCAIALGSGGTALVFALLARFLGEQAETFLHSPLAATASVAGLVVFVGFAYVRVRNMLRE